MKHLLPTEAEILSSLLATDCSRLVCFCLASASTFSAFLALVSADLAALLAETLAAFASFRAYVIAFNSASKAIMRA
jgi:hypothetical protein